MKRIFALLTLALLCLGAMPAVAQQPHVKRDLHGFQLGMDRASALRIGADLCRNDRIFEGHMMDRFPVAGDWGKKHRCALADGKMLHFATTPADRVYYIRVDYDSTQSCSEALGSAIQEFGQIGEPVTIQAQDGLRCPHWRWQPTQNYQLYLTGTSGNFFWIEIRDSSIFSADDKPSGVSNP